MRFRPSWGLSLGFMPGLLVNPFVLPQASAPIPLIGGPCAASFAKRSRFCATVARVNSPLARANRPRSGRRSIRTLGCVISYVSGNADCRS